MRRRIRGIGETETLQIWELFPMRRRRIKLEELEMGGICPHYKEVNFLCCFLAFLNKPKLKSSPLTCYCSIKHTVRKRILLANHTILTSSKGKRVPPLSIDVLVILSEIHVFFAAYWVLSNICLGNYGVKKNSELGCKIKKYQISKIIFSLKIK